MMIIPSTTTNDRRIVYIIFNSIPPYAFEANIILALPDGMPYRARFRKEWHPDINNPRDIELRDGVLVLRDWDTGSLIPIRRIRIRKVDPVGDIYYIDYLLTNLIEYDSDDQTRDNQVKDFNERILFELRPYQNNPGEDLIKLVFMGSDLAANISDSHPKGELDQREFDNWGKIVSLIGKIGCYLDQDFLKIIRLSDEGGKQRKFVSVGGIKRYSLSNTKVYYLDVFQRSFTTKTADSSVTTRTIKLSAEIDAIKPIRDRFAIVGKYDMYRFRLKAQAPQRTRDTDIAIDTERADQKGPVPTIYLPVRITTPITTMVYRIVAALFFIFGAILLFFGDTFFQTNADVAKNVGIFLMILAGPGTREAIMNLLEWLRVSFTKS